MASSSSIAAMLKHDAALQYAHLRQPSNCPSGVYLSPSPVSPTSFNGVLFVHKGYYVGAVFRFTLTLVHPSRAPEVRFAEECVHPLVEPQTRRMLLSSRFPSWRPRQDMLSHVLFFIKAAFKRKVLDTLTDGSAANSELFRIYRTDRSLFSKVASQSAASSLSPARLYAPASSATEGGIGGEGAIRFEKLDDARYEEMRRLIFADD